MPHLPVRARAAPNILPAVHGTLAVASRMLACAWVGCRRYDWNPTAEVGSAEVRASSLACCRFLLSIQHPTLPHSNLAPLQETTSLSEGGQTRPAAMQNSAHWLQSLANLWLSTARQRLACAHRVPRHHSWRRRARAMLGERGWPGIALPREHSHCLQSLHHNQQWPQPPKRAHCSHGVPAPGRDHRRAGKERGAAVQE